MFDFIKYIKPFWYYRLTAKMPQAVLLDDSKLDLLVKEDFLNSGIFKFHNSKYLDLAYQALTLGYLPENENRSNIQNQTIFDIADNYRFIHRHFGKTKALYVLILRVLFLNNPFREVYYFITNKCQKVKNSKTRSLEDSLSRSFEFSKKVSVIIPTLNRYEYLKDVLLDLQVQTYQNFDVLICDQSDEFDAEFYENWNLDLHVIQQKEKALWYARNRCIKTSDAEYLLFFDDDSRVEPNWIEMHLKICIQYNSLISAGVTNTVLGGGLSANSEKIHLSDVLDTGNVLIHRSVFDKTGLFDESFERMRMGDGEFGLRSLLNGFMIISNPYAKRVHLKVEKGGLRHMGAWDAIHNIGLFKPKPIPSSLYFARKHFDTNTALIYGLTQLPKAFIPYAKKNSGIKTKLLYYFISILFAPLLLINCLHAWRISGKMLRKHRLIKSNDIAL